jgi:hypothetical protein
MTIQLQLKPEIEARLIAEATAQGLSVEAYLASLIENSLTSHEESCFYQVSTQEEWEAILTDLINIAFTRLLKYTRTFYIKTSSFKNVPH